METTSYACPVCGTVDARQWERYPNHVCSDCKERARCIAHDRGVTGYNTSMSGGFVAFHAGREDDPCDQVTSDGGVLVDGAQFRMREAYMGGVVVVSLTSDR